jgi:Fic family protein
MKKREAYKPQYQVGAKAVKLIAEIAAALERYKIWMEGPEGVRLRKVNHVKTLRGTTAIEGNTLTEAQIMTLLAGKRVKAPAREIKEIRDAHRAYEQIAKVNPYSAKALLQVHGLMTSGLVEHPGRWRTCEVGVVDARGRVLHRAPTWKSVPPLMKGLFKWLGESEDHVLVKSCVFHYEFEFIHPFPDGNGRMGRYWQTAILGKWNPLFYAAPVENMVYGHQRDYYRAIRDAGAAGHAGPFVDFMLGMIVRTIRERGVLKDGTAQKTTQKTTQKTALKTAGKGDSSLTLLSFLKSHPDARITEMAERVGLSADGVKWNLRKLKASGRLRRVGADRGGHWEVI